MTSEAAVGAVRDRLAIDSPQGQAIIEAATRCFDRWGVERTRMSDIAEEAGMARPTVYRYFATKEALCLEVMLVHIRLQQDRFRKMIRLQGPARAVLNKALLLHIRESDPRALPGSLLRNEAVRTTAKRVAESEDIFAELSAFWLVLLDYASSRGELRPGVDPRAGRALADLHRSRLSGHPRVRADRRRPGGVSGHVRGQRPDRRRLTPSP